MQINNIIEPKIDNNTITNNIVNKYPYFERADSIFERLLRLVSSLLNISVSNLLNKRDKINIVNDNPKIYEMIQLY